MQNPKNGHYVVSGTKKDEVARRLDPASIRSDVVTALSQVPTQHGLTKFGPCPDTDARRGLSQIEDGGGDQLLVAVTDGRAEPLVRPHEETADVF